MWPPDSDPQVTPARADSTEDELTFGERAGSSRRRAPGPADPDRFRGTPRFQWPLLIGQGGMGLVYRVRDVETGQDVALKTLRTLDPDELYRLKQEFRVLAGILHPNLVHLYELFAADGDCFLTMELLQGQDFVRWVRGDRPLHQPGLAPDGQARLRVGLRQLVAGLSAVHAAGRLHRDIKPSNVLVTHHDIVKILDFGLTTPLRRAPGGEVAGTPVYMAPELAHGAELGVASDWYSVGVMVYEALTAHRPHRDDMTRLVLRKDEPPQDPRHLAADLDADLCDLALALLRPDPERRPTATEILARLDGQDPTRPDAPPPPLPVFVGREPELRRLRSAWLAASPGRPSIVHLHGPSGMGKTELARHFLRDAEAAGTLVLAGRCLAQESVPYKALDAVVDALRHALGRMPPDVLARCRPEQAAPLLRVFPVLRAVPTLVVQAEPLDALEPHELRRRAFGGLRELLSLIAQVQPVAVAIDDLQWSDLDSIHLLRDLLRPPDSPGILMVLSWRSEAGASSEALRILRQDAEDLPAEWRTEIELEPLDPDQTLHLARALLGPGMGQTEARAVAQESLGSPFFCGELARHRAAGGEAVRLADVVGARLATLSEGALALLEVVAVAGRPIDQALALQSAGLGEAGRPAVAHLQQACLVRTSPLRDRTAVEPYHDRVREAIVARMTPTTLRDRHRTLADALGQRADADPEHLITHHLGAGDVQQACRFALQAAHRAAATLAFTRAAHLYQLTLDLMKGDQACEPGLTEAALRVHLAGVLAQAGRGAEAGLQYQAAAELVGEGRPGPADVLTLQRRAAEQFLHSGRIQEGKAVLALVLGKMGIALPPSPLRAMLTAFWHRGRLLMRGLEFRPRSAEQLDPDALARLDALWGASTSMALVHHTIADALGVRHLRLALELGEPSRLCRALGYEAAFEATLPHPFFQARSQRLLKMVAELAEQTGSDYDRAWFLMTEGGSAWFGARWREVVTANDAAEALYRARCQGVDWEIAIMQFYTLSALASLGELKLLQARMDQKLADALSRGDLFAANHARLGQASLGWLAQDRLEYVRAQAAEALSSVPAGSFHMQHYYHLVTTTLADLYAGEGPAAWARVTATWPDVKGAQFLLVQYVRTELHHLRGRAALAALEAVHAHTSTLQPGLLRKDIARQIDVLAGHTPRYAPFAEALRAGLAVQSGRPQQAIAHLAAAVQGFEALDMALYRESARLAHALGTGDEEAATLAHAWFRAQGVVQPHRLAATLMPGCGLPRDEAAPLT